MNHCHYRILAISPEMSFTLLFREASYPERSAVLTIAMLINGTPWSTTSTSRQGWVISPSVRIPQQHYINVPLNASYSEIGYLEPRCGIESSTQSQQLMGSGEQEPCSSPIKSSTDSRYPPEAIS
ncbi:hypothetical protein FOXYSP1_01548 [Fusarium oxysporum f. sp. phaseoli]